MQVPQTAGEPPTSGRVILATIGWTLKSRAALKNKVEAKSRSTDDLRGGVSSHWSLVIGPRSLVIGPRSSVLSHWSSVLHPRSSVLCQWSSILGPPSFANHRILKSPAFFRAAHGHSPEWGRHRYSLVALAPGSGQ